LAPLGIAADRFTGVAGPSLGPAPAPDAVVFLGDDLFSDPVVTAAKLVSVVDVLVPRSPQRIDAPEGGEHHVPYFPDYLVRAPNAGYVKEIARRFETRE
jgi:hypothetical protein